MFLINIAVFLSAAAAISYEIIGGSVLTILLGSSIFYFSLTIGVFLAALGIGGWFSSKFEQILEEKLALMAALLALLGGLSAFFIFGSYVFIFEILREITFGSVFGFLSGLGLAQIFFSVIALSFIFAIGILAGLLLPLFSRIVAEKLLLKDALGKVFFWDYAGALVVSILLPIILFPIFGIIKTSFLMGIINALAALAMVIFMSRIKIKIKPILVLFVIAIFIVNIFGFFSGNRIESFLEEKQYGDREILYRSQSPYQRFSFLENKEDGKISLYINGQRQFESGEWDAVYHETFVHPAMALKQSEKDLNVLILGGGDGLALREILKYKNVSKATLVDIDSALVLAAKNLDAMRKLNNDAFYDPRTEVVFGDAFKFVEEKANLYDIVFIDFPDPTDDGLARLYSKEFYLTLKKVLRTNGMAVIQSGGYMTKNQKIILSTMEVVGFKTLAFHPPFYDLLDQNFGFTLASESEILVNDFDGLLVAADTRIFNSHKLNEIFAATPIPRGSGAIKVNSIFRPSIVGSGGFAVHYLESLPFEKILAQINLPEGKARQDFKRMFYE
jgi:spermidine synthase